MTAQPATITAQHRQNAARATHGQRIAKICPVCGTEFSVPRNQANHYRKCADCNTMTRDGELGSNKRIVRQGVCGVCLAPLKNPDGKQLCPEHSTANRTIGKRKQQAAEERGLMVSCLVECDTCPNELECYKLLQVGAPMPCEKVDMNDVLRVAGRVEIPGVPGEVVELAKEIRGPRYWKGE